MADASTAARTTRAAVEAAGFSIADPLLEYGSPVHRVADYLKNGDNESINRREAAMICGLHINQVDDFLQFGVISGLLTFGHDADSGRVWRAGLKLGTIHVPPFPSRRTARHATATSAAPAALPAPTTAPPATRPTPLPTSLTRAAQRGGRRRMLPELDPATLQVIEDMPPRQAICRAKGLTRYDEVFDRLTKPGSGTLVDKTYRAALGKAVIAYSKRTGRKFSIYSHPDGTHCAVRREA